MHITRHIQILHPVKRVSLALRDAQIPVCLAVSIAELAADVRDAEAGMLRPQRSHEAVDVNDRDLAAIRRDRGADRGVGVGDGLAEVSELRGRARVELRRGRELLRVQVRQRDVLRAGGDERGDERGGARGHGLRERGRVVGGVGVDVLQVDVVGADPHKMQRLRDAGGAGARRGQLRRVVADLLLGRGRMCGALGKGIVDGGAEERASRRMAEGVVGREGHAEERAEVGDGDGAVGPRAGAVDGVGAVARGGDAMRVGAVAVVTQVVAKRDDRGEWIGVAAARGETHGIAGQPGGGVTLQQLVDERVVIRGGARRGEGRGQRAEGDQGEERELRECVHVASYCLCSL